MIELEELRQLHEECIGVTGTPVELLDWISEQGINPLALGELLIEYGETLTKGVQQGDLNEYTAPTAFAAMLGAGFEFGMRVARRLAEEEA